MVLAKKHSAVVHAGAPDPSLDRQSLRDKAYETIRQRIITLEFRPGAYINEAMICEQLGIGRTPVHMAIERLSLEGLVEVMPRKGIIVAPLSFDEMKQINETRRMVEPPAAALAAQWATDDEIATLTGIAAAARLVPVHDTKTLMELDSQLHNTIADATRNRILASVLKGLHERSLRNWYISLSDPEQREKVAVEHDEVTSAIRSRDPIRAESVMREHIDSFKRRTDGAY